MTGTTTIANHRVYDAYGKVVSETNSAVVCLFGFTGRPFDIFTGLQNNLHRRVEVWPDATNTAAEHDLGVVLVRNTI